MKASLYLHIPFCQRKCSYCDFNSFESPGMSLGEYAGLLRAELAGTAQRFSVTRVPTVYFGGGTPSLLPPPVVKELLQAAGLYYSLDADVEVTMEANPGTVTLDSLSGYRDAGVNRLSLGIQALEDRQLAILGRIHTADEARDALKLARRAGFANVGIDLMHSLPGQSLAQWEATLRQAVELEPEHVSAYGLSVELGTPFAALASSGKLLLPDEDAAAAMFEFTAEYLTAAGYEHYEISNFARPGCRSRHNQVYWRRENYLGFGAGAHSFARQPGFGLRWENPPGLAEYAACLQGTGGSVEEVVSREDAMAEFFFLGLRMLDGVDLAEFAAEFGISAEEAFPGVIGRFTASGLLLKEGERISFTRRGVLLANRVLAEFV
ncbi:MAG TPA: radical SAM family heme chaperone HemW [Geobacteraceae bacterium]|nr:radical SAM family heme chaperone HemW [Geobacteraceae bacterium]